MDTRFAFAPVLLLTTAACVLAALNVACPTVPMGNTNSGVYDPSRSLALEAGDIALTIPAGALAASRTITITEARASDLPERLPGSGVIFSGAFFEPDGTIFTNPATVEVTLENGSSLPELPVLTFDEDLDRWVGTGDTAVVSTNGLEAEFPIDHFSIAGIPEAIPIPTPGDLIDSVIVLSNNALLQTDAISAENAALIWSDFGDTFNIAATSQEFNDQGQLETKAIGLDAILVERSNTLLIGVVGGATSIYNDGQFNEPLVGVMVMAVHDGVVQLSLYVASPDRVIQGTLIGAF